MIDQLILKLMLARKSHRKLVDTVVTLSITVVMLAVLFLLPVNVALAAEIDASTMVQKIVNIIESMLQLVGGALIVFGGFTAVLGYYQERPDDTARGFRTLAVGAGLLALATLAKELIVWTKPE